MYNSFPSKAVHYIDSLLRSMHMGHQFLLNHFSCRRRLNLRADTGTKGCSTLLPIHTFASLLFPLFSKSNKCLYHFNSTRYQRLFHLAGIRFPRFYILRQPPAPLSRQPAAAPQMPSFSLLFIGLHCALPSQRMQNGIQLLTAPIAAFYLFARMRAYASETYASIASISASYIGF